jgi:REP element-mobilizing transposase RayT
LIPTFFLWLTYSPSVPTEPGYTAMNAVQSTVSIMFYGTPRLGPNPCRERVEALQLKRSFLILNVAQRGTVEKAVREVCRYRQYALQAVNARTNHVHAVISAACKPEPILDALKAYATRKLRRTGLISSSTKPWIRHGSTRYLWKERHVERAIHYVLYGQGDDDPPDFDD